MRHLLRMTGRRERFRAISLWAIGLAMCAVFAIGAASAAGATPTIALTLSSTAVTAGAPVTMTATVSSADGNPTGSVNFFNGSVQLNTDPVALVPVPGSSTQSVATLTLSFAAGTYAIVASYRTKSFVTVSTPPTTLTVGTVDLHPTTVVLRADPAVIVPGQQETLVATVTETNGGRIPTGVVTFDDNGIPFTPVSQATLDATGQATLAVAGFAPGPHVIHASYVGDSVDHSSSTFLDVTVPDVTSQAVDTTTTVTATPSTIHAGDTVTIVAHVTQVGRTTSPAAGTIVTFTANNVPLDPSQAFLDANGDATIVVRGWLEGSYSIDASYIGDINDNASTGSATVSVAPPGAPLFVDTQLSYKGATSGVFGDETQLSAVLTDLTGSPLSNEPVTLSLGSQQCVALTNAAGVATCTITLEQTPSNYPVKAAFDGDGVYQASHDFATFAIGRQATTLVYTGSTSVDYGDATSLGARLFGATGLPLPGQVVTLTIGTLFCSATTGSDGVATCGINSVTLSPGTYQVSGSSPGDAIYLPSTLPSGSPFVVRRELTTATVSALGPVVSGAVALHGTVLEDGLPLAGAHVALSLGGVTCPATTDSTGAATCSVTATTLGFADVGIVFGGDEDYLPSSAATANGALVYAWPSGQGAFVVGDRSATGSVTFWGARWAKLNLLGRGAPPDAFKGFAAKRPATCGGAWSTGPGNSSGPPSGPLPAYMGVLVSDSISKSGPAITGSTVHIIVVETDPGYKKDPGHPGTGRVIATVC